MKRKLSYTFLNSHMLVARRISPYHISESSGEKVKRKNKPNFFCPIYKESIITRRGDDERRFEDKSLVFTCNII